MLLQLSNLLEVKRRSGDLRADQTGQDEEDEEELLELVNVGYVEFC